MRRPNVMRRAQRYAPNDSSACTVGRDATTRVARCMGRGHQSELTQRRRRHCSRVLTVYLDSPVQAAHRLFAQTPTQQGECGDDVTSCRGARTEQGGRLVRRKEVAVVIEHHEVVARKQPVGGEAIDDVDGPTRERLVLECGQERRDRARSDAGAIDLREPRETVLPLDEVGREPCREMRALACKVAQGAQPILGLPSPGAPRWRRCSGSRGAGATAYPSEPGRRCPRARRRGAGLQAPSAAACRAGSPAARCPCTPDTRPRHPGAARR